MNATITRHSQLTSQLLISSFDAVTLKKVFLEVKSKVKKTSMAPKLVAASNHKDHHMHYALPHYDFTTILIQMYSLRKIFFAKNFLQKISTAMDLIVMVLVQNFCQNSLL